MKYSYYPGCSLHATGIAYDKSVRAVFKVLGEELKEIEDWNCCGATAYMSVKETVALTVSARNLALAQKNGHDIMAPCSACFTVLNKTRKFLREIPEVRRHVESALQEAGLGCNYDLPVRHPLEILVNDVGHDRLVAAQKNSLEMFRPACYYGCQIVRPEPAVLEDQEVPMSMELLLESFGARPVEYPPKVQCCGGMLVVTYEDVAITLCHELLAWAERRDANCIVVACPMCQANLDMLTNRINAKMGEHFNIPILYFTQLVGLALGCSPKDVGLEHGIIGCPLEVKPIAQVHTTHDKDFAVITSTRTADSHT